MSRTVAELVKERLERQAPELAQRWEQTYIQSRPDDATLSPDLQIEAVNHFWRVQLGSLPVNTIDERECLVSDASVSDWIRNFEECVIPTIVKHKLPL